MTDSRVFIHPGFPKTGTTTLQNALFEQHSQVLNIGRPYTRADRPDEDAPEPGRYDGQDVKLGLEFKKIEGIDYDHALVESLIHQSLDSYDASTHRCVLLSDELLVIDAHVRIPIIHRLKALFSQADIIFTVRHQINALESFYGHIGRLLKGVPAPYNNKQVELDDYLAHAYKQRRTSFLGMLEYHDTIRLYEDVFGADRVHVFVFEEMVRDLEGYANKLSNLLGIDAKQAYSLMAGKRSRQKDTQRQAEYKKMRQKMLAGVSLSQIIPFGGAIRKQFSSYLNSGSSLKTTVPAHWKDKIETHFRDGNRKLIEERGLPLEEYGYPV